MRFFMYLAYDGAKYHGWQIQPNGISIQEVLMNALSKLTQKPTEVTGAGRTDAGVNARLMTAHFDCDQLLSGTNSREETACKFTEKLNRMLPQDIAIYKTVPVADNAHARFDATSRTYQYFLTTARNPFTRHYSYRFNMKPDYELMNKAAKKLFDYTDFTSFSKLHTDVKTNNCKIMEAGWKQINEDEWVFTIKADRFLRNMVRSIVGTLLDVGRGKLSIEQFCRIIEGKDRCLAGTSVPGNALFLTDIEYPESTFNVE